jgi:DNA-binding CsgD family transcriptional regulator/tetratricopeptide (TPR) repeat protein
VRRVSSPTFVGRAEQLAAFDESLAGAAARKPSLLLVSGESGVGKSRLVAEFASRTRAAGGRVLCGDCIELGDGELPYAPIVGALRDLIREIGPDRLAELAGPSRGELGRLLPDAAGGEEPGGDEEFAQARLFELLVRLFGQLGQEHPLVLIIEDLHWADRSTRDFLSYLSRAAHNERLVVVGTYRSDELHRRHPLRGFLAELERLDAVERIELAPFSRLELTAQLSGILGHSPDPAVIEELFERTEGNAFFVEELLAAGEEGGRTVMPGTLRDALMVRVESLQPATQEVLRAVAASGRAVTHGLLADVSPSPEPVLIEGLREAVTNHVLVQKPDGQSYAFRHALMREVVYDDLLPGERGSLHVRLAEALEGAPSLAADSVGAEAELAWHWSQAHELPHALGASVAAAGKAEAMHAPAEAARHLENALELWDRVDDPERVAGSGLIQLLRRAAENFYHAGDSDRAVALARRTAGLLDPEADPVGAGLLHERLGRYLWTSGRDSHAAEVYGRAVELMPPQPPSAERALVLGSQAQVLMLNGRLRESAGFAREAIDIARAVGDRSAEAHALNTLGVDLAGLGAREEGIELLRDSLAIHEELGEAGHVHRGYVNLSDVLDQSGRVEESIDMALHGARRARDDGMGRGFASFLLAEAANRCTRLGRLAQADDLTRRALDYGPGGVSAGLAHVVRASVLLKLGRVEEARPHVAEAKRLMRQTTSSMWIAPLYGRLAEQAELDGSIDQARQATAEFRRLMEGGEGHAFYLRELYLTTLRAEADAAQRARAARDRGAEEAARRSGEALAEDARRAATAAAADGSAPPQVVADLDVVAAEESRLEGQARPELWRAAADANERIGNRLAVAYAHMREAEAIVESGGDRNEAAASLHTAHEIALDCGAEPLREACAALARRARIGLAGQDAPAAPGADPFGLTAREREVLELVAAGRTNRQIGEGLFMSEKTASVHVSRILAKLDVSTRGEAGAVAHKLGLDGA